MAEAAAGSTAQGAQVARCRRYVAYYRMSTSKQARASFSLEAQQAAIANYVAANPGKLIAEYSETRSGTKSHRPKLAEAVQVCRIFGAVLLIARLDRLARNIATIAQLMDSKVDFVAIDFPHATRFTLHILAAIAEHESRLISERVKLAQAAVRARGQTWSRGRPNRTFPPGCQAESGRVRHARSQMRIRDLAPLVWKGITEGKSYAMIADEFNRRGIRPAMKAPWQQGSIGNIARATRNAFAATAKSRLVSPPGLRRTKMLDRLEKFGPLLLEWRTLGMNYSAMARELDRLGYAAPYGRGWGRVSTWRYLKRAIAVATARVPYEANS
jgi:DNA invertase Pin-like site-specific DNA recombinase